MSDEKLDRVLRTVDPRRRSFLKKLVLGAAFSVPIIASYSVKDLAYAQVGSPPPTTTKTITVTTKTSTITTSTPLRRAHRLRRAARL